MLTGIGRPVRCRRGWCRRGWVGVWLLLGAYVRHDARCQASHRSHSRAVDENDFGIRAREQNGGGVALSAKCRSGNGSDFAVRGPMAGPCANAFQYHIDQGERTNLGCPLARSESPGGRSLGDRCESRSCRRPEGGSRLPQRSGNQRAKDRHRNIKARILVCIGADDPLIPPEQRAAFEAEMRCAGADWQMHLYGNTVHGFTNPEASIPNMPEATRYSALADARSRASPQELLSETLGQTG
jgi:hypothetical protein